jgi:phage tail sheath protein FI
MAATYGAPGVYVEEMPSGSMPVEGVGTSVAAFVGFTEKYDALEGDPTDPEGTRPQLVTSWPQYQRIYGGFRQGAMLPYAVRGFFENGGSTCFIVRIRDGREVEQPSAVVPSVDRPEVPSAEVRALGPSGRLEVELIPPPPPVEGEPERPGYTLRVFEDGQMREEISGLQFGRATRALERTVRDNSQLVQLVVPETRGASLAERMPVAGRFPLEAPAPAAIAITPTDLQGSEEERTGYSGLAIAEDVTIVAIPDLITISTRADNSLDEDTYLAVSTQLVDFCELSGTMMAIIEVPPGYKATQALAFRNRLGRDTAFAALYYPHIVVSNPLAQPDGPESERFLTVPAAGHLAGVWARTDATRGVWKAPANENVRGLTRLSADVTSGEQDLLNPVGINCIRAFGSFGTRVWGGRTLARTDPSWKYINVRRLFNFIEESIRRGTRWAVFEPNDEDLRERVKRNTSSFLRGLHRQGALVGATPEQAYYVLCDGTNNPPSSVDEGKLIVEIGICPVKPAEFVIFRISQWQGGGETTE